MPDATCDAAPVKIDYQLAIVLRAKGFKFKEIADQLGCKVNTVRAYFSRHKLSHKVTEANVTHAKKVTEDASKQVQETLASVVLAQAKALNEAPTLNLATKDGHQGQAAVAKTIAETAKTVFNWGSNNLTIMFGVSMLSDDSLKPVATQPVVDVQATSEPVQPSTEQSSDTPTQ